jgi:hypothetical protein
VVIYVGSAGMSSVQETHVLHSPIYPAVWDM